MPTCNWTTKILSHSLLHIFCLHFQRIHHDYFFQRAFAEAVAQTCSMIKVFLKISQNSLENTCARVSLKNRLWHRCFPANFAKFLRTPFFTEHLWKCTSTISLRKYKRVTCNLPVQLQFLKVNFLYVEYAIGRSLGYSFCQINLNSFVSCNVKITEHPSFCSVLWYVLFYKKLTVLHHGGNNFLFYFDICIKFTLSSITSTMKKWQHLTWCVLFYDENMFVRKTTHPS